MLSGVKLAGVIRNEGMNIARRFPKVKSQYILTNSNGQDRYLINLGEKAYSSTHQIKNGEDWVDVAKSTLKGAFDTVQEKCMKYIELLSLNNYR